MKTALQALLYTLMTQFKAVYCAPKYVAEKPTQSNSNIATMVRCAWEEKSRESIDSCLYPRIWSPFAEASEAAGIASCLLNFESILYGPIMNIFTVPLTNQILSSVDEEFD